MKKNVKKIITTIVLVVLVLTLAGCGNSIASKSIEQAKIAIESKDYEKALASLELALDKDSDNKEAKQLYSIVEDYQKAKGLMEENNTYEAEKVLDGIDAEYVNYAIKEDVDSLKLQVKEKIKGVELVKSNLNKLLTLVNEKKYDEANTLVEEINKSSLNEEQKNSVNELKTRIDSEVAQIETQKKAEEDARVAEEARKAEEQKVEKKEEGNQPPTTKEKAVELVRKYLTDNGEYIPGVIAVESENSTEYTVHGYDDMGTHTATSGWYYVNKSTGKVTSEF